LSHLFTGRLNSELGLMENDSFDLRVPTCTVETTLGGFSNCIFVHKLVISLFHLFVCVKEKIYSKKCQIQLCNGRILKTSEITICLRKLLLYCQYNKCRNVLSSFPSKPSINPSYILMIFCNWKTDQQKNKNIWPHL